MGRCELMMPWRVTGAHRLSAPSTKRTGQHIDIPQVLFVGAKSFGPFATYSIEARGCRVDEQMNRLARQDTPSTAALVQRELPVSVPEIFRITIPRGVLVLRGTMDAISAFRGTVSCPYEIIGWERSSR
jgi:hypothetical protein